MALARRRAVIAPEPWTWLHQVHGADVVTVTRPGEHAGAAADGAVTEVPGAVVAVHTADCAPVVLLADGAVGVAHAGWRGLAAGVIDATVGALAALGAPPRRAVIGPCIGVECYEFGSAALDEVAAAVGDEVRGTTRAGTAGLDLPAGVRAALGRCGIVEVTEVGGCTACDAGRWYSHRARQDPSRMATVAWLDPPRPEEPRVVLEEP